MVVRSHRQLIIDTVKANPEKTTKELYRLIQEDAVGYTTGSGVRMRPRRNVPVLNTIRTICTRTPGIINLTGRFEAVWVWVGVDVHGRTIEIEQKGAEA